MTEQTCNKKDPFGIDARDLSVLELASTGKYTNQQVADNIGISRPRVSEILHDVFGLSRQDLIGIRNEAILLAWRSTTITVERISEEYNIAPITASRIIRQAGLSTRPTQREVVRAEVRRLYSLKRHTNAEIGTKTGMSKQSVNRIVGATLITLICTSCGGSYMGMRNRKIVCAPCSNLEWAASLARTQVCVECGIVYRLKHTTSIIYGSIYCSLPCSALGKKRKTEKRNRRIRREIELEQQKGDGILKKAAILSVAKKEGMVAGTVGWIATEHDREIPPVGWHSDAAVLAMNDWSTAKTKVELVAAGRKFRNQGGGN